MELQRPTTAAARRFVGGCEFDRLLDRLWDMGARASWGGAPGRRSWVGFYDVDGGWAEAVGPTLEHAARTLHVLVLDCEPEEE